MTHSPMHVPTQYITNTFRILPASFSAISLAWGMPRTFTVSWITWLQCSHELNNGDIPNFPKECNCSVPEWLIQRVFLQCSQPVKPKMSQNNVQEVNQSGTFGMYPSRRPQCTTFSKIWENFGNTASKCLENWKTGNIMMTPLGTLQKKLFEWATQEHHRYFLWENPRCSYYFPNGDTMVTWPGTL